MKTETISIDKRKFFLKIILPSILTIALFTGTTFSFFIPYFELNLLNAKKQMIREIVFSAKCIAEEFAEGARSGQITETQAKEKAARIIGSMRYGAGDKDYLWITDLRPVMIMHPYRTELNGEDLTDFEDARGKKMFSEFVRQTRSDGEAYVDYMWQWMDDESRIVPKISFIMEYKPWGWLIGTGVYLEDIRREISGIKKTLVWVSIGIFGLMTLLLTMIVRRNLRVEMQRSVAEQKLKESRERYKALVEASTDSTLLFLDGKCMYANKKMKDILAGLAPEKLSSDLHEIIHPDRSADVRTIKEFQDTGTGQLQLETLLAFPDKQRHEALINISEVALADKTGFICIIKDLSAPDTDAAESALLQLAPTIRQSAYVGIFTATLRGKGRFTEVSPAMPVLLGYGSADELKKVSILDMVDNLFERRELMNYLAKYRKLEGYRLRLRKPNGGLAPLLIYAAATSDEITGTERLSGFCIDDSPNYFKQLANSRLTVKMEGTAILLNSLVKTVAKPLPFCAEELPFGEVAVLLHHTSEPVVAVQNQKGHITGTISPEDLVRHLANVRQSAEPYARDIMNPNLHWCSETDTIEAVLAQMGRMGKNILLVKGTGMQTTGFITHENLTSHLAGCCSAGEPDLSSGFSIEHLVEWHRKLPAETELLIHGGAKPAALTSLVTQRCDRITEILAGMVIREMGPPPARFALLALGSQARKEQTLLTDQDNALIYDNATNGSPGAGDYFLRFGTRMNELLHHAGYERCKGDIMAGNARWNQPLDTWKKYFAGWITEANPQNIVDISVFFDYRTVYGDDSLTRDLRNTVNMLLDHHPSFFNFMAMANLTYKIPLTLFGRLQTETSGDTAGTVNLKNASRVLVSIIRLYSMKHRLEETNTLARISHLYHLNVFPHDLSTDLTNAFEYLLSVQFRYQASSLDNRILPGNNISLSILSSIEIHALKAIFSVISGFQNRLKQDFGVVV